VAADFHRSGLVDRYVVYLAPALAGGDDARGLFAGPGAASIADVARGRIVALRQIGPDVRIDMVPLDSSEGPGGDRTNQHRGTEPGEGAG
jgi:diaminohydroxyphosphoribosylaminopyrimidine deaminase/5-amino-6-(5-phosphoribosylamino)uracil reductase